MNTTTQTFTPALPHLREWARQNIHLGVASVASFLQRDQLQRWLNGERVPAEEYIQLLLEAAPGDSTEHALALIGTEVSVRRQLGESPSLAEFVARFTQHADQLRSLFGVETAPGAAATKATMVSAASTRVTVGHVGHAGSSATPSDGDYELLRELGRGGMGVVFEAHAQRLGRRVALKIARLDSSGSEEARLRFLSEARIAARLEHPGVVPVHDLVMPPESDPFYTMKLVRGRTLADAIDDFHSTKRAPSEQVVAHRRLLEAFLAICHTMAFAHSKSVIHRDLKPANVVLGEFGEKVILDWGLAKVLRTEEPASHNRQPLLTASPELTVAGAVMGTPAYMSPEQAAGRTDVDERSDIYALGAILYHILTGQYPHRGHGHVLLQLIQEGAVVPPSQANPGVVRPLEAICQKAMAKRPEDRYPSAQELAADVERYLAGEPVSVYRERWHERLSRWTRRHQTLVTTGTVAAVLTVVGIAAYFYLEQRAEYQREAQANQFKHDQDQKQLQFDSEQREEKQRQAFEERKRQEQARMDSVERATSSEKQAKLEMLSGRFRAAERFFAQGAALVRKYPELAARAAELDQMRLRAQQIAVFYRVKDRADSISAGTSPAGSDTDLEVILSCERALQGFGVLHNSEGNWWERLPNQELSDKQKVRLAEDTTSMMVLLAVWRIKYGLPQPDVFRFDKDKFRDARQLLAPVQRYYQHLVKQQGQSPLPPGSSADVLELFIGILLGEDIPLKEPLQLIPRNADDAYFMGVAQWFIAWETTSENTPEGKQLRMLRNLFGRPLKFSGLDLDTPQFTSERFFRTAVTLYPEHYWAHWSLGHTRRQAKDWHGSEEAFNTCVALRPENSVGYTSRFRAVFGQAMSYRTWWADDVGFYSMLGRDIGNAVANRERSVVLRRALDGLDRAPQAFQTNPMIRWQRYLCHRWLGDGAAFDTGVSAIEALIAVQTGGVSFSADDRVVIWEATADANWLQPTLEEWMKQPPNPQVSYNLDHVLLSAAVRLAEGKHELAARIASWALQAKPNLPRARAIIGMSHLNTKRYAEALKAFDAALEGDAINMLALTGRALALEQSGDTAKALEAFAKLTPAEEQLVGPLHLIGLLGQARVFAKLGKPEEARQALERVREVDPVAAERLTEKLFPTKK